MRYRAVLVDPLVKHDRPVQMFSNSMREIELWADAVLLGPQALSLGMPRVETSHEASVVVYRIGERRVAIYDKKKARVLREIRTGGEGKEESAE